MDVGIEQMDFGVEHILLESMGLCPLDALRERRPAKFVDEIPFRSKVIEIIQEPGCATGNKHSNGGTVWNCSRALTKYIELGFLDSALKDKLVIEIGSGTGLTSLAAACVGARATLTDKPSMCELLSLNIQQNHSLFRHLPSVTSLPWGSRHHSLYDTDWDVVLASDVVYHREDFDNLLYTFSRLCGVGSPSRKRSALLLSFKLRDEYPCQEFFERIQDMFEMTVLPRDAWLVDDKWSTVYLYYFMPKY
eukprot:TRINITY_DN9576_c0_g1_i1.p1 TRINITY_DN9576_c0_g1~~TRINITY_DN9576_c0_g1_i1.p1  ORF type:complete len:278 (-),score=18.06 TRINITY_DN9576_c0_g1_i1:17-763(-)